MKRWVLLAIIVATTVLQAGCGDGVAYSHREWQENTRRHTENDIRQLNDDWHTLWLDDEPGRLSRWRVE